ncbi:DUF423 domain-containing protein [Paenibacillus periandrae]|uniref:DUF423 domain-containing protein n=1 Tax=Paenibacillus periandrae TaxID=1761741 RepID=UPI001F093018|nr:DUF423 domain-containing protein [Paenibacillus periandrae]
MNARFVIIGCICALLSVLFGAFGAHSLKDALPPNMLANFQTGVQYQMYHGLGLILIGFASAYIPNNSSLNKAGWSMLIGIILFSGSLYVLSMTGVTMLGIITPFGGVAFLLGWLLFIIAARKSIKK